MNESYYDEKREIGNDSYFSFNKEYENDTIHIIFKIHELTMYNAPSVLDNLVSTYDNICRKYNGNFNLSLDCSSLRLLDSSGVGVFIHLWGMLRKTGNKLSLYGMSGRVKSLSEKLKLNECVDIHD